MWPKLSEMFPQSPHVFIDEATVDYMDQIDAILNQIPKDGDNFVWIVDMGSSISEKYKDDFKIEKGLALNLRNSQEMQEFIPYIHENNQDSSFERLADNIERIMSELNQERDVTQIMIIVHDDSFLFPETLENIKLKLDNVYFYGFADWMTDCSNEDLDKFFQAPNHDQRQILITRENFVEGFEAEMVLFQELHHAFIKSTLFRAKTRLKTLAIKQGAHPMIKKQFPRAPKSNLGSFRSNSSMVFFGIESYVKIESGPDFKALNYLKLCEDHQFRNLDWTPILEQMSWMKQYNLIVQENSSEELKFPLLLWLQTSDQWKSCYCIDLRGTTLPEDDPLKSLINGKPVEIVELTLSNQVHEWESWINILKAEITHSNRLNIELKTRFDFRRLFSIGFRILKELKELQYFHDTCEMDNDDSYDKFRIELLEDCFKPGQDLSFVKCVLESHIIDTKFPNWNLIDDLLNWLRGRFHSKFIDFLISWEISHFESNNDMVKNTPDPEKLRKELDSYWYPKSFSQPLISTVLDHEICRTWREVLEQKFPHVVHEMWFPGIVAAEKDAKMKLEEFLKIRGSKSIYRQNQEEAMTAESPRFNVIKSNKSAFAHVLVFVAKHTNLQNTIE